MGTIARIFWPLFLLVPLADCTSKQAVVDHLGPAHVPHEVIGSVVRFTLGYNPGMAFGIDIRPIVGDWSRVFFILIAIVMVSVLLRMYRGAAPSARLLPAAIALAAGGAIGNAMDRFRSRPGVVDFIDIGVGNLRFWTFNIADVGVIVGALLLAGILWWDERNARPDPTS